MNLKKKAPWWMMDAREIYDAPADEAHDAATHPVFVISLITSIGLLVGAIFTFNAMQPFWSEMDSQGGMIRHQQIFIQTISAGEGHWFAGEIRKPENWGEIKRYAPARAILTAQNP